MWNEESQRLPLSAFAILAMTSQACLCRERQRRSNLSGGIATPSARNDEGGALPGSEAAATLSYSVVRPFRVVHEAKASHYRDCFTTLAMTEGVSLPGILMPNQSQRSETT